jgi:hypothetical protein
VTEGTRQQNRNVGGTGKPSVLIARVAGWLLVPLYIAGLYVNNLLERRAGFSEDDPVQDVMLWAGFGAFAVVGAVLVAKRPTNLIGWIMATIVLMVAILPLGGAYATYVMATHGRPDALAVLGAWTQNWYWYVLVSLVLVYLPLLFPDGRLPSRWWLPVALVAGIGTIGTVVLGALADTLLVEEGPGYEIDNPIGIEGLGYVEDLPVFGVLLVLLGVGIIGAVTSLVVRFRRSRGIERQQMKWIVYAAVLLPLVFVSDLLPDAVGNLLFGLILVAIPTAIGIAVMKYRLYDIDIIINRTLVYGPLTATLALIYVGGVVGLQALFRTLTGQESTLAVVASTLAIAALFNPLRRRVQALVDRRFYRKKYDARKTLETFSTKLRDETDLGALSDDLLVVIQETMQPTHVTLWLRPDTAKAKEDVPG